MDVELISVEMDLSGTKSNDELLSYMTDKCIQLGMSVTSQTRVNQQNVYFSEILQASLERTPAVMIVCNSGIAATDIKKIISDKLLDKGERASYEEVVLDRHDGAESGWLWKKTEKFIAILPGTEIQDVFDHELYSLLQKEQKEISYSATLKLCGITDTKVNAELKSMREKYPTVKFTVKTGKEDVIIHLLAQAGEENAAKKMLKPVVKACLEKFKDAVYATDDSVSLEASVLELLKERDLTLTTAESLTGGLLAAKFTAVPGASDVFKQGFVTYCNRAKRKLLDVKKTTLKEYGAVSDRTAKEMAKNGVFATGADACVSLTGLAGPAAEEGKPVGLVYIACCYKNRTVVREYHFKGNRNQIREQSATQALLLLRECILSDQ